MSGLAIGCQSCIPGCRTANGMISRSCQGSSIDVMIGPRSALFTPFSQIGLIIIDEEHEGAYKSETVPRYDAREAAVYRASLCGASVILGSATPSVETAFSCEKRTIRLVPAGSADRQGSPSGGICSGSEGRTESGKQEHLQQETVFSHG